jgi:hypothetical protein
MSTLQNRSGFALPMAILTIGLITAGVVASFARVGAEVQTVDNVRAQTEAFALAEAGLAEFLATPGLLAPGADSLAQPFVTAGGTATVQARRLYRTDGTQSILVVRSTGRAFTRPGRPQAQRTVAQFAIQSPMQMQVLSSWTSLSGVSKNGNSGWFGGEDQAGLACGDGVTRAGIAVPDGGAVGPHIGEVVSGSPPIDQMGTVAQMAAEIKIDWAAITDPQRTSLRPTAGDRAICNPSTYGFIGAYPCGAAWPTSYASWPTVVVNGSTSFQGSGRGILIVTGNLTLGGNTDWDGIIMVGGMITDNGQGQINGSVITGLNVLKGEKVAASEVNISLANGQKRYQFDSCAVQRALLGNSPLRAVPNAWVDNWMAW